MKHHLVVGTWTPPGAIFTVVFDDEELTLENVKRTAIPEDEPISWLTISQNRKQLYGASMKKWSSHSITSGTEIKHEISHEIGGHPLACKADTNTRAIFALAAKKPPYCLYGNPFYKYAGFGNVFSTDADGKLLENIQNYEYSEESAIHGMVFDPEEEYLYSADMWGDKVWTHKKDSEGKLTLVGSIDAPTPGDHPRWVELHPSGKYLYALMEAGNNLAVYVIDEKTHLPVFTHITYPLVPPGKHNPSEIINARKPLSSSSNTAPRHPQHEENVSIRRSFLLTKRQIPLRDCPIQLSRRHRLHQRLQTRRARKHRTADLYEPHADQRWSFERC